MPGELFDHSPGGVVSCDGRLAIVSDCGVQTHSWHRRTLRTLGATKVSTRGVRAKSGCTSNVGCRASCHMLMPKVVHDTLSHKTIWRVGECTRQRAVTRRSTAEARQDLEAGIGRLVSRYHA